MRAALPLQTVKQWRGLTETIHPEPPHAAAEGWKFMHNAFVLGKVTKELRDDKGDMLFEVEPLHEGTKPVHRHASHLFTMDEISKEDYAAALAHHGSISRAESTTAPMSEYEKAQLEKKHGHHHKAADGAKQQGGT